MKKSVTLLLLLFSVGMAHAQVSTQGKDFWVGLFTSFVVLPKPTSTIYISAKDSCSGTITNRYTGYSQTFNVPADSAIAVDIPYEHIWRDASPYNLEVVNHFAVHVVASDTVSVFAISRVNIALLSSYTEASFFIPTEALGANHIVVAKESADMYGTAQASIIATEDNTEIEITPVDNSSKNLVGGNTYTVTLNEGETYSFNGITKISGAVIRAKDSCKRIAVFAGNLSTNVWNICQNRNHIFEAVPPVETWGQNFYCPPIRNKPFNIYRIMAAYNNTVVKAGLTTRTLNQSEYTDITTSSSIPLTIKADKPVAVMGFITGGQCTGFPSVIGAPGMYWVPAVEKKIYEVNIHAIRNPSPDSEYVNIVVDTADMDEVTVNGSTIIPLFKIHPSNPAYAYAQYQVTRDVTRLVCKKGFTATAYSYSATTDSYIYSVGCDMRRFRDIQYTVNGITRHVDDTLALCTGKNYTFGTFRTGEQIWEPSGDDTIQRNQLVYGYTSPGYHIIYNYPPPASFYCIATAQSTMAIKIRVDSVCVQAPPDTVICRGQSLVLAAREANAILTGCRRNTWYVGNTKAGISPLTVQPLTTTQYKLISTDTCTGTSDSLFVTVHVRPAVQAILGNDTTLCKGQSFLLSARASGGDSAYIYTWIKGITGAGFADTVLVLDTTASYAVSVSDECTVQPDTAYITVYVRPELQLQTRDTTLCTRETVVLRPEALGGDSSYIFKWKHNGAISDTLVFTADTTTAFEIWLTDGCTVKPDTAQLTVFVRPDPQIAVSDDTTICIGGTAVMEARGLLGDSSYIITWNGLGAGNKQQVSPVITAVYEVAVDDQCSALGDTAWVTVYVRPAPKAVINNDTTICVGQQVELRTYGTGGDSSYIYAWDQGLGNDSFLHIAPVSTTVYRLILGDECSHINDTVSATVYVRPPLQLTASNDTLICIGESVTLEAWATGGDSSYRYRWDQGLGNGSAHMVSPVLATAYTVTLEDDCSPAVQAIVNVSIENKPVVNFIPEPVEICAGEDVHFTNLTQGALAYLWQFGDQQSSAEASPNHIYTGPGVFSVRLIAASALGCADSLTVNNAVRVYPKPQAAFIPSPAVADILTPFIYFENHSQLATSYLWDFGDMHNSAGKDTKHQYADSGWYQVILYVTSNDNCMDTAYGRVRINDYYRIFVPTAFSPNQDGINELFEVKGRGVVQYHISIYNRWGERVFESFDINDSWNGKLPNQERPSPDNLYYYMIDLRDIKAERHIYQGNIMLLK